MGGKNPSRVENLRKVEGLLCFRFRVILLSSMARINPVRVTNRAAIFIYRGMVSWGTVEGIKLWEIMNPATMLPISNRIIEFVSGRLFSLIKITGGNRGFPSRAKKIMRALYTAVSEVAIRVSNRAQAFVYDVLTDSIIESFE